MKKTINNNLMLIGLLTTISLISVPSYADNLGSLKTETRITKKPDGTFVKEIFSAGNDSEGTRIENRTEFKSKLDKDGDYKKSVENKTVVDPKGLMNKKTTKTNEKMEKNNGDTSYSYTKKINGKTIKAETLELNKN